MKRPSHLVLISRSKPAQASLSPFFEFIYIVQALVSLVTSFVGVGVQALSAVQGTLSSLAQLKGASTT